MLKNSGNSETPCIRKKAGNTPGSLTADLYRSWRVGWLAGWQVCAPYIPLAAGLPSNQRILQDIIRYAPKVDRWLLRSAKTSMLLRFCGSFSVYHPHPSLFTPDRHSSSSLSSLQRRSSGCVRLCARECDFSVERFPWSSFIVWLASANDSEPHLCDFLLLTRPYTLARFSSSKNHSWGKYCQKEEFLTGSSALSRVIDGGILFTWLTGREIIGWQFVLDFGNCKFCKMQSDCPQIGE